MNDGVLDTTVVACANCDLRARTQGNSLNRRAALIERCVTGSLRVLYNKVLLQEYKNHIREHRNDLIESFFAVLDSATAFLVRRSTLSRQDYNRARACRWPSHDQHLLAAALGGVRASIYVTEQALSRCAESIRREFRVRVEKV